MPGHPISRLQPAVAMIFCALWLALSVRLSWIASTTPDGWSAVVVVCLALLLSLAYGLWRQHGFALRCAAMILLLVAIVLPPGIFNVFSAGDYLAAGEEPPSILSSLVWLIPLEVFLLGAAYVLDVRTPRRPDSEEER